MKTKYYVGYATSGAGRQVFRSAAIPTAATTPQYAGVIGPFRTARAARYMAVFGTGNPHMQDVASTEKIAALHPEWDEQAKRALQISHNDLTKASVRAEYKQAGGFAR